MKAFIMAGGKGTRIASEAPNIPKPMIPVLGKPILEWQLACLEKNDILDVTIITGHLGDKIIDHFTANKKFHGRLSFYQETEPLGTAGALYNLDLPENFLLINGDIIFDMDISRFIAEHTKTGALATIAAHPNGHPFDSALIVTDGNGRVTRWINKEDPRLYYKNMVNAGIHILSKKLFASPQHTVKVDLDRDILKPRINEGSIFAYHTPEYIRDMGTPERLREVVEDLESGLAQRRNLKEKQRAIFLDRDGSLNCLIKGFITKPFELELLEGAALAVKIINKKGYLAILITNQPVIARGDTDLETLEAIHNKLETDLGREGAYLDDIFFCPHHPDKGFPGERLEYKIECDCRKPKPGMILEAAEKYHIDLANSYMVGDSWRDVNAGIAAGCTSVLLGEKDRNSKFIARPNGDPVQFFPNLLSFVTDVLG